MATAPATAPPVLSTPDTHIFNAPIPTSATAAPTAAAVLSPAELCAQYEIPRTLAVVRAAGWTRVALQFPDEMLGDAVRVYEALERGLNDERAVVKEQEQQQEEEEAAADAGQAQWGVDARAREEVRLCVLGDTSYGACCVDEIAAEHVDAQAVVHYGRTCLSATARLPVVYVYTTRPLDLERVVDSFCMVYDELDTKIMLVADAPYVGHMKELSRKLVTRGYTSIFRTELVGDASSPVVNRTVPPEVVRDKDTLRDWHVFHVGQPPAALLLTLSSRVASVTVYANDRVDGMAVKTSSALTLRRRYALVTSLSTCAVYGILINTLSVKNYMHIVERVKQQISAAGKKHYTFVVGKVNAAKIANFSEIGGWVVIGCWESSLVESSEFNVPLITPFELQLALQADDTRIWTGEWTSNFEAVLAAPVEPTNTHGEAKDQSADTDSANDYDSEEDSAPPEFDLRTGRYISHSRPMQHERNNAQRHKAADQNGDEQLTDALQPASTTLVARPKSDIARVGGVVSPGAEYLRSQRTWQGLGSDFDLETDFTTPAGTVVEEGRSGVARGYTVGPDEKKT